MASQRASRRWKGCCLMCAMNNGKVKGAGTAARTPFSALRRMGTKRRITRYDG